MAETHLVPLGGLDSSIAAQFTRSALAGDGTAADLSRFRDWWADRLRSGRFEVSTIPFAELDQWVFDRATGNLVHQTGRYFTVEGLQVRDAGIVTWTQPVMNQWEIAILGILAKEFDGVLHFLMQAKMEPGNVNVIQLSPTVQATQSNYTRVHRGANTRYLEYFRGPNQGRVLVDVLQSELGAWFVAKRNRNIVVRTTDDVPEHPDFHWLTLGQIRRLLGEDNQVNMDARTVLACMPLGPPPESARRPRDAFTAALLRSYDHDAGGESARHTDGEVLSWFTEAKTRCHWRTSLIPLADVAKWSTTDTEIVDDERRDFRIVGVRVHAGNREITQWSQPLLAPRGERLAALFARPIAGVLHVLVQAVAEPGLRDLVEIGPTVQFPPGPDHAAGEVDESFLDLARTAAPDRVRYDTVQSEEGGRFYLAQTRYRVIDVGEDFPIDVPDHYRWLTVRQLMDLVRHAHYLNIEARTLLACLHSLW